MGMMARTRFTWLRRARRALSAVIVGALLGVGFVAVAPAPPAQALSGSEFMPGYIIADSLFYDAGAMTESDIQLFLASKGSALAHLTFTVASRPAAYSSTTGNLRCSAFTGGTLSAATIIYRAQVACGISAKVLLVTLQKEQGLITKSSPSQSALDRAMGYACPDTAPCAPTTLGFGNQVYSGALQFNTYRVSRFGRQPGVHSILFNPNSGCGSTAINIQNYATAALYNYTPYQPNAAALANLGGTGDGCSSYGNRNFWYFYSIWFGSTLGNSPYPVVNPGIVGNATVGTTLTVQPGIWRMSPTFSYSWVTCPDLPDVLADAVPDGCTAIPGATTDTYVTTPDDVGDYIAAMVTGSNGSGGMIAGALLPGRVGSPVNTIAPTVSGVATLGTTWTADVGTWTGTPPPTIVIYWLRCSQPIGSGRTLVPTGCEVISGENGTTYVSTAADVGKYLTFQVGGNSPLGFALAVAVNAVQVGFPYNTVAPTVSGLAPVGSTWAVDVGTWTGTPSPSIAIYWLRCNQPVSAGYTTVPAGCHAISGANGTTYVSTLADTGKYLTAQIAGNSPMGFALAGAVNTTSVQASIPANTVAPTVSGTPSVGSTWTVDVGTWTGAPTPTFAIYWLRCNQAVAAPFATVPSGCSAIAGAHGSTYSTTASDAGKYVTAQIAGNNALGFGLAGAISPTPIQSNVPVNTMPPTVSGTPAVGSTWTVNTGTWTGSPTIAIYWLRCNQPVSSGYTTVPAGCTPISGANATTYVAAAADAGKYLTAQVAGNSPSGFAIAGAVSTTPIQAAVPVNTAPPTVSGSPAVGSTWTANPGTWTGSPTIAIYWLRCTQPVSSGFTTVPAGCQAISGATGTTYVSTTQDVGKYLTVQVAGNSPQGFALAGAVNTTAVQPAVPVNTVPPTVSGSATVGSTWTVNTGTWTGSPTIAIYWLRCNQPVSSGYTTVPPGCVAISGATGTTYQSTAADNGKYLTAQVAGNSPQGFALAGAVNTTQMHL
jgi:hypothetical protein